MSVSSEMKWRKQSMTIQPTDCQCLPELTKHLLLFAIDDAIASIKVDLNNMYGAASRNPELVNSQSWKMYFGVEAMDEAQVKLRSYEFLRDMIKSMSNCKEIAIWEK